MRLKLRPRERSKFSPCAEEAIRIRFIINPSSDKDVVIARGVVHLSLNLQSDAVHDHVLWCASFSDFDVYFIVHIPLARR